MEASRQYYGAFQHKRLTGAYEVVMKQGDSVLNLFPGVVQEARTGRIVVSTTVGSFTYEGDIVDVQVKPNDRVVDAQILGKMGLFNVLVIYSSFFFHNRLAPNFTFSGKPIIHNGKAVYFDEPPVLGRGINPELFFKGKIPIRVTSPYKAPRNKGPHKGIDYAAPTGTPLYSATAGTVRTAGFRPGGGGVSVYVTDEAGEAWYMHLSKVAVKAGQKVVIGQLLGYTGSTGESTGPHLHFQYVHKGTNKPVDSVMTSLQERSVRYVAPLKQRGFNAAAGVKTTKVSAVQRSQLAKNGVMMIFKDETTGRVIDFSSWKSMSEAHQTYPKGSWNMRRFRKMIDFLGIGMHWQSILEFMKFECDYKGEDPFEFIMGDKRVYNRNGPYVGPVQIGWMAFTEEIVKYYIPGATNGQGKRMFEDQKYQRLCYEEHICAFYLSRVIRKIIGHMKTYNYNGPVSYQMLYIGHQAGPNSKELKEFLQRRKVTLRTRQSNAVKSMYRDVNRANGYGTTT